MHPASTLSNLDCAVSGTTGCASSRINPLSLMPCWLHRLHAGEAAQGKSQVKSLLMHLKYG